MPGLVRCLPDHFLPRLHGEHLELHPRPTRNPTFGPGPDSLKVAAGEHLEHGADGLAPSGVAVDFVFEVVRGLGNDDKVLCVVKAREKGHGELERAAKFENSTLVRGNILE